MARLDDALATIEAEREARLHLETRTARLEADLCAPNERPRCPRPPLAAGAAHPLGREFRAPRRRRGAGVPRQTPA